MTKNKIKKLSIVALTGLVAVGAYAFIKDSRVQSGTNLIRPGQISIQFTNESDSVALSGNTAIPMSDSYAKTNLVSYKFDIVNDGDVDLDYSVYAYEINSTFNTAKIDVMLKDGEGEMLYVNTLENINKDNEGKTALVSKINMAPNDTHSYELIAHIDGSLPLDDYTGKETSFKLIVDAEQHTDGESGGESSIDLTNINSNGVAGDFSTKGNLVNINNTQYRVLSVEGTQAKVMSMETYKDSIAYDYGSNTISFGESGYTRLKYENSEIDKEMTNYYNSLPSEIQNAIVEINISQSLYKAMDSSSSPIKSTDKLAEVVVGPRKVYALDVDDVLDYLGDDYSVSDPSEINQMFFNTSTSISNYVWLRTASTMSDNAYNVDGDYGNIFQGGKNNANEIRPAFVIDLSLLG